MAFAKTNLNVHEINDGRKIYNQHTIKILRFIIDCDEYYENVFLKNNLLCLCCKKNYIFFLRSVLINVTIGGVL